MTEYLIFLSYYAPQLSAMVNEAIKKGWKCQGGVSVAGDSDGLTFVQAMVRTTDSEGNFV